MGLTITRQEQDMTGWWQHRPPGEVQEPKELEEQEHGTHGLSSLSRVHRLTVTWTLPIQPVCSHLGQAGVLRVFQTTKPMRSS